MKMFLYILFFLVTLFLLITFTLPGLAGSKSVTARTSDPESRALPKSL